MELKIWNSQADTRPSYKWFPEIQDFTEFCRNNGKTQRHLNLSPWTFILTEHNKLQITQDIVPLKKQLIIHMKMLNIRW